MLSFNYSGTQRKKCSPLWTFHTNDHHFSVLAIHIDEGTFNPKCILDLFFSGCFIGEPIQKFCEYLSRNDSTLDMPHMKPLINHLQINQISHNHKSTKSAIIIAPLSFLHQGIQLHFPVL